MVEWSIAAFRACESVGAVVVAYPPGHAAELDDEGLRVVEGGATRSQSVSNALAAVDTELVVIHDAARPLVTPELIAGVVTILVADPEADGAIAATPVVDTIKRASTHLSSQPDSRLRGLPPSSVVNSAVSVVETVDRETLWAAQTPQVFRTDALRRALEAYPRDAPSATDEAMLVEADGGRVLIHPSSAENLKVTTRLDLRVAELLLVDRSAR